MPTKQPTKELENPIVLMNKREAKAAVDEIRGAFNVAGFLLITFRDREGFKALGYGSFQACCEAEFREMYGTRGHIYALIQQAEVTAHTLGKTPQELAELSDASDSVPNLLPIAVTRELAKLPADDQKAALQEAKKRDEPLAQAVSDVVEKRLDKKQERAAATTTTTSPVADEKLEAALVRIGKVCGKPPADALRDGRIALSRNEILAWSKYKDAEMKAILNLVQEQRLKPTKAYAIINAMVGANSRVCDIIIQAIALGGKWHGVVNGWSITVERK